MTTSNSSDIFGGSVPTGAIVQGQFKYDANYLPCDGGDYLKTSYPGLDYTGLETFGSNTPVSRTLPRSGYTKVAAGAGIIVALTSGTTGYSTSTDGINWTTRTFPESPANPFDIIFANGVFVVMVGGVNRCYTSSDGINWTSRTIPTVSVVWSRVRFVGGLFFAFLNKVANSSSYFSTSPDGITWTLRTAAYPIPWGVAYGNGIYAIIHYHDGAGAATYNLSLSIDAVSWGAGSISTQTTTINKMWEDIVFSSSVFIAMDLSGGIYQSTDNCVFFTKTTFPGSLGAPSTISIVNGQIYTLPASTRSQILFAPNIANFKSLTNTSTVGADSISYGNGILVIGCLSGSNISTVFTDATKFRTPIIPKISDGDRFYIKAK